MFWRQVNVVFMAADHYDVEFDGMWVKSSQKPSLYFSSNPTIVQRHQPSVKQTWCYSHRSNTFASQNFPE